MLLVVQFDLIGVLLIPLALGLLRCRYRQCLPASHASPEGKAEPAFRAGSKDQLSPFPHPQLGGGVWLEVSGGQKEVATQLIFFCLTYYTLCINALPLTEKKLLSSIFGAGNKLLTRHKPVIYAGIWLLKTVTHQTNG